MKTMISAPAKKILLATVLVFAFTDAA